MTVNEYQTQAMTTLNPELSKKDVLINSVMGLCGESGEAIDLVKKWLAQGHALDKEALIKELGGRGLVPGGSGYSAGCASGGGFSGKSGQAPQPLPQGL